MSSTFCEAVSRWVEYPWDHADWDAFLGAIEATGEEVDAWFSYPIMGSPPLELRFSLDRGGGVVSIVVEGELDSVLLARLETLCDLLSDIYQVREPGVARAISDLALQRGRDQASGEPAAAHRGEGGGLAVAEDDDWLQYFGVVPTSGSTVGEPWIRSMNVPLSARENLRVSWDLVGASVRIVYSVRGRAVVDRFCEAATLLTGWANHGGSGVIVEYKTGESSGRLVATVRPAFSHREHTPATWQTSPRTVD